MVDLSNVIMMEEALTAKKRNSLDNSKFALVYKDDKGKTIRKYPVHDKAHVQAASKMFPRGVPEKYQGKVARRILAEAREYKLDTSGWDNVNKAADKKVVQEFEDPIKSLQEATSGSYNDLTDKLEYIQTGKLAVSSAGLRATIEGYNNIGTAE